MDSGGTRAQQRFTRAPDISFRGPRNATYRAVLYRVGHRLYRFELAVGSSRKPRFNDIDAPALQLPGNTDVFLPGHGCAGTLFASAQSRIENNEMVFHWFLR